MAKRPIPKPDLSQQDVSLDDAEVLMEMGLTQQQALETLTVFHKLDEAMIVVEAFKHPPKDFEASLYRRDYDDYLSTIITALSGLPEATTPFDEEVMDRTLRFARRQQLYQRGYRDQPSRADHYWEHQATRGLDRS